MLGVRQVSDLRYVEVTDLDALGLKPVQRRRLSLLLQSIAKDNDAGGSTACVKEVEDAFLHTPYLGGATSRAPDTPRAAKGTQDSRPPTSIQSISAAGLLRLLTCLSGVQWFQSRGLDKSSISSIHIREYLLSGGDHPARMFPDCFSMLKPVAALTYEWRLTLGDVLSFLNPIQIRECNDQHCCSIPTVMAFLFIWVDVLFIDQLASDIASNLLLAQRIYAAAPFHLVIATATVCTRAWVLFELCVRREAGLEFILVQSLQAIDQARPDLSIETFIGQSDGRLFEGMTAFLEEDKDLIRRKIVEAYGTPERFNKELYTHFLATWKNAPKEAARSSTHT